MLSACKLNSALKGNNQVLLPIVLAIEAAARHFCRFYLPSRRGNGNGIKEYRDHKVKCQCPSKTKCMITSRYKSQDHRKIWLRNDNVEKVKTFKYLGTRITEANQ